LPAGATELKGDAVAAGVATGRAAIVFDPKEVGSIGTDYVLICPNATRLIQNGQTIRVDGNHGWIHLL
jgi:hypothetical protein